MLRFAIFLLILTADAAHAAPPEDYAGRYRGCAISGGEWVPIETTLTVSGGSLSGSYLFIESNGRSIAGMIEPRGPAAGDSVSVRWRDIYGDGPAVFRFSNEGARFDGYWMTETGEDRFTWYGVRVDDGGKPPDCRVPVS